jgi:hypothetical protein
MQFGNPGVARGRGAVDSGPPQDQENVGPNAPGACDPGAGKRAPARGGAPSGRAPSPLGERAGVALRPHRLGQPRLV